MGSPCRSLQVYKQSTPRFFAFGTATGGSNASSIRRKRRKQSERTIALKKACYRQGVVYKARNEDRLSIVLDFLVYTRVGVYHPLSRTSTRKGNVQREKC